VGAENLVSWLGLSAQSGPKEARASLKKKRSWYQSMQSNPKHKDAAKFLIKNYRAIDGLLDDPPAYRAAVSNQQALAQVPMLEMVIDGVLVDGTLTPIEEAFVRDSAMQLGIDAEVYQRVLIERADAAGVALPRPGSLPPPITGITENTIDVPRMAPGTGGAGWWNDDFSSFLLTAVPPDTKRLVDLAAGLGWGALSIVPHRPHVEYLGVDKDPKRLEMAKKTLMATPIGGRVHFVPGQPEKLPLPDGAVDVVLCVMALHRMDDVQSVLSEAARLLRPGGRAILIEPDRRATRFWFDGELEGVNRTYRAFIEACDAHLGRSQPASHAPCISAGPLLGRRLSEVGLTPIDVRIHHVVEQRIEQAGIFGDRMATEVAARARNSRLRSRNFALQECNEAIDQFEVEEADRLGVAVISTPLFMTVATQ
jgi:SAM-dependent methyltransferase